MLRKGKTKTVLQSSINSALLAVEIYNKPRAPFRVENYISLMIIAWTRLFHAHFNHIIGDKYYYKEKNNRYKKIDGEKKAWELKTCIKEYGKLNENVKENLEFFIKIRNKIEHRHIDKCEIGVMIFGECQALLYNYETILIDIFGEEYAINESLAFSLQFSRIRLSQQERSSKKILSKEVKELKDYITGYRNKLDDNIFNSQEFSIKLIQIPKISNTNKNDIAIEFVNWNSLSGEDKESYEKVTVIVKDKVLKKDVINPGKLKPSNLIDRVNETSPIKINHYDHKCLYFIFSIRPTNYDKMDMDPFDTNTDYCHYDEVHNDYLFQEKWVEFILGLITTTKLVKEKWRELFKNNKKLEISDYEIMR
ncbi:MAG: DUF3644 domain-containing protein [Spirochaetes bacterium]|nr:DUF3644 domain-containing protein [Spirochaetota bacterium]